MQGTSIWSVMVEFRPHRQWGNFNLAVCFECFSFKTTKFMIEDLFPILIIL